MKTANYYKRETTKLCKQKGWYNADISVLWMCLVEEVGELASSIRRASNHFTDQKRIDIEGELMDVLSYLFHISDLYNIDLDRGMTRQLQHAQRN